MSEQENHPTPPPTAASARVKALQELTHPLVRHWASERAQERKTIELKNARELIFWLKQENALATGIEQDLGQVKRVLALWGIHVSTGARIYLEYFASHASANRTAPRAEPGIRAKEVYEALWTADRDAIDSGYRDLWFKRIALVEAEFGERLRNG